MASNNSYADHDEDIAAAENNAATSAGTASSTWHMMTPRNPSLGNVSVDGVAAGGIAAGRRAQSADALSATLPSRQDTLSALDVASPLSPAGSIHSANSTAAFSVGMYRFSYCPICFEHFTVENPAMVLVCGHVFHAQCHLAWRDRSSTCAVCSAVIDDSRVRMMHGADLHARSGKGPLPVVPAIPLPVTVTAATSPSGKRPPRSPTLSARGGTATGVGGSAAATQHATNGNVGRPTPPSPPSHVLHVVRHVHTDDDLDGEGEIHPRVRTSSGGGIAGGVDDFLHTVQRAFSCFRCGRRPTTTSSSAPGTTTHRGTTGVAAARRPLHPSHQQSSTSHIRGEATSLRTGGAVPPPFTSANAAAAAAYEEQDRRMLEEKGRQAAQPS